MALIYIIYTVLIYFKLDSFYREEKSKLKYLNEEYIILEKEILNFSIPEKNKVKREYLAEKSSFSLNKYIFEKSNISNLELLETTNSNIEYQDDENALEYIGYKFKGDLYSFYVFLFNIFNDEIVYIDNNFSYLKLTQDEYQIYLGILKVKNEI